MSSYDHPHIIEGQGTIGLEIMEQLPMVDAVMVPVGGGGLITGIAIAIKHLKPETEVYVSTCRYFIDIVSGTVFTIIQTIFHRVYQQTKPAVWQNHLGKMNEYISQLKIRLLMVSLFLQLE